MVLEALERAGGVAYLAERAVESPALFMALVGKVLPVKAADKSGSGGEAGAVTISVVTGLDGE